MTEIRIICSLVTEMKCVQFFVLPLFNHRIAIYRNSCRPQVSHRNARSGIVVFLRFTHWHLSLFSAVMLSYSYNWNDRNFCHPRFNHRNAMTDIPMIRSLVIEMQCLILLHFCGSVIELKRLKLESSTVTEIPITRS